ncbi:MAG: DUF695 domain-containing protein [Planctomycetes bacterium]|nr:DUF695 domain-containing protein [Planctomycetota bacterium]
MDEPQSPAESSWFHGEVAYEGLPLFLRFPAQPDVDKLSELWPWLLVVTHRLEHVTDRGLPTADYNDSLIDFDEALVRGLSKKGQGTTVLVETFDCLRSYYFYARDEATIDEFEKEIVKRFPEHQLEWFRKPDPNWKLFRDYSTDFNFYP